MRVLGLDADPSIGGTHNYYPHAGNDGQRENHIGWVDVNQNNSSARPGYPSYGPANFLGLGPKAGNITHQFP